MSSQDKVVFRMQESAESDSPPGPIDNSSIARDGFHSLALTEGQDYQLKSPATWQLFCHLYPGSGPEVALSITADGKIEKPTTYLVHRSSQPQAEPFQASLYSQVALCHHIELLALCTRLPSIRQARPV